MFMSGCEAASKGSAVMQSEVYAAPHLNYRGGCCLCF